MDLPILSSSQYLLVHNAIVLSIVIMAGSTLFFLRAHSFVSERYQVAMAVSATVVFIAGLQYLFIYWNWENAYAFTEGQYIPTGIGLNHAYRYMDWIVTVPLLMVEMVAILGLDREKSRSLTTRLVLAAVAMIVLGYPGEISESTLTRLVFGGLSTLPFLYIVYVLWVELSAVMEWQSERIKLLFTNVRLLTIATWGFYPIAFLMPVVGLSGGDSIIGIQVGYSIADILAKCGYGVLIYSIAKLRTEAELNAIIAE